ncbi:hypothetical protein BMS3Bbin02_00094 [bacterium BMS3Bbin02]|nr:hypothetical protein BMS3Bbin02_00094 [bacterium BMS3Bbin02]
MSDSPDTLLGELTAEDFQHLTSEDIENEALRQECEWYLSEEGFIDFARDSGAAPHAQFQPHGRYARDILHWNGTPDPDAPQNTIYKFKMVLWPRGSFKSTVFDIGLVCWLIAKDPNIRILVASETGKQAKKFVAQAMVLIDSEWFKERFGTHRGKKWKSESGEFYSALRTDKHKKEPTLIAAGVGEVWTGAHWDFVIMDDVIGKENSKTLTALEAAWEWFGEVLAQLDPGCKLLVIGTLWHHADIYCKLMEDPAKAQLFEMSIHAWKNDDESLFFPGRLTPTYVANQKKLMSPRQHACFYWNRPFADEDQIFKEEYFQVIEDHEIPSAVWTYILTDWAFVTAESKKGRPDKTCFWVISLDANRMAYVRDFYVGRWKPEDSVKLCCTLWNEGMQNGWNMKAIVVEKSTHEELLNTVFEFVRRETFVAPRFVKIGGRNQEIKDLRIEASQPKWARREMYFARSLRQQFENKWRPMQRGMVQWPLTDFDDIADAQSDLDKKNERDKYYCPAPPPGWRSAEQPRRQPAILDGKWNADYKYPPRAMVRRVHREATIGDIWLGNSGKTASSSGASPLEDPSLQPDHPVNRFGTDPFQGTTQGGQSIFRKRSNQPRSSDRFW